MSEWRAGHYLYSSIIDSQYNYFKMDSTHEGTTVCMGLPARKKRQQEELEVKATNDPLKGMKEASQNPEGNSDAQKTQNHETAQKGKKQGMECRKKGLLIGGVVFIIVLIVVGVVLALSLSRSGYKVITKPPTVLQTPNTNQKIKIYEAEATKSSLTSLTNNQTFQITTVTQPKTARLLQGEEGGADTLAVFEFSHPNEGITILATSPEEIIVHVDQDKMVDYFYSNSQRRLQEDKIPLTTESTQPTESQSDYDINTTRNDAQGSLLRAVNSVFEDIEFETSYSETANILKQPDGTYAIEETPQRRLLSERQLQESGSAFDEVDAAVLVPIIKEVKAFLTELVGHDDTIFADAELNSQLKSSNFADLLNSNEEDLTKSARMLQRGGFGGFHRFPQPVFRPPPPPPARHPPPPTPPPRPPTPPPRPPTLPLTPPSRPPTPPPTPPPGKPNPPGPVSPPKPPAPPSTVNKPSSPKPSPNPIPNPKPSKGGKSGSTKPGGDSIIKPGREMGCKRRLFSTFSEPSINAVILCTGPADNRTCDTAALNENSPYHIGADIEVKATASRLTSVQKCKLTKPKSKPANNAKGQTKPNKKTPSVNKTSEKPEPNKTPSTNKNGGKPEPNKKQDPQPKKQGEKPKTQPKQKETSNKQEKSPIKENTLDPPNFPDPPAPADPLPQSEPETPPPVQPEPKNPPPATSDPLPPAKPPVDAVQRPAGTAKNATDPQSNPKEVSVEKQTPKVEQDKEEKKDQEVEKQEVKPVRRRRQSSSDKPEPSPEVAQTEEKAP